MKPGTGAVKADLGRHRIGSVARLTGLSIHTLRAWERRHAVVTPQRTPGGDRRYSDADVTRLLLLKQLVARGHMIAEICELADVRLRDLLHRHERLSRS
jgi:DNA-binding transcriptional MerR regulator